MLVACALVPRFRLIAAVAEREILTRPRFAEPRFELGKEIVALP